MKLDFGINYLSDKASKEDLESLCLMSVGRIKCSGGLGWVRVGGGGGGGLVEYMM